jgi:hypothetical protein
MRRQLRELPPGQRLLAIVALAISLALVTAAERDLHRRSAQQVRGSRLLWRIVCLNALGAIGYFRWGRRGPGAAPPQ